jgi:galactonate dehydratase
VTVRITAVKGFPVQGGLRNLFIVKIETDAGICGLGEGGMSGREWAMQGMLEHCAEILVGMDPERIEHIWQVLYRSWYFEGGNILGAVISAVDLALWDILGKRLGVPVYQLLGGACRERVGCFATPRVELTGPECVEAALAHVARGWHHLRFLPGMPGPDWSGSDGDVYEPMESVALAAHWLREVRQAVGPEIALAVDFHHRLNVAEAASFCAQVSDLNLWFLEEPIRAENPKAYAQLRAMTPVPFAIGEEFASKWEFLPFVEEGLLNYARVDLSNVGGLSEAKKVAGWCEAHYVDMVPHNPLGPVTTAASIHFAASISNFGRLEYLDQIGSAYPRDLFPEMPELAGDGYPLPSAPGLGVSFDEAAAAAHPFVNWEAPRLRRRDGAHTNW